MNYKIDFVSLAGHRYQIRIYDGDTFDEAGATSLRGGVQPIVTNEEDSHDILLAVRYSTGYINIVTDDVNLRQALMPQRPDGIRVTLVRWQQSEPIAVWEGYISQESYSQPWAAMPVELEVPIISRLGMVCQQQLSSGNTGIISVGQWLQRVAGNVYDKVLITDSALLYNGTTEFAGETVISPTALECAFSEEIFKTPIPLAERLDPNDTETNLWHGGTNEDIANTLSVLFRWVFFERGGCLVCADPAVPSERYISIPSAQLTSPLVDYKYVGRRVLSLGEDVHVCSDSGTTDIVMPYGSISVIPKTDSYPTSIIKPLDQDFMLLGGVPEINGGESRPYITTWDSWDGYATAIKSQRMADNPEYQSYQYYAKDHEQYSAGTPWHLDCSIVYANAFPETSLGNSSLLADAWFGGGEITSTLVYQVTGGSRPQVGDQQKRYTSIILGRLLSQESTHLPAVTMKTHLSHAIATSPRKSKPTCLCISGMVTVGNTINNMAADEVISTTQRIRVYASIRIGDKYIGPPISGPSAPLHILQDNVYYLDITTGKRDDGRIEEHYNIYMDVVDGPVEVTLYTPVSTPPSSDPVYIRIDEFEVSVSAAQAKNLDPQYADEEPRKARLSRESGNALGSLSFSPAIGEMRSPNALYAINKQTANDYGSLPATKIGILVSDSDGAPQLYKRCFEWLCRYYNSSTTIHTVPLSATDLYVFDSPCILNMPYSYMPLAMSADWRQDEFTLKLIQIK